MLKNEALLLLDQILSMFWFRVVFRCEYITYIWLLLFVYTSRICSKLLGKYVHCWSIHLLIEPWLFFDKTHSSKFVQYPWQISSPTILSVRRSYGTWCSTRIWLLALRIETWNPAMSSVGCKRDHTIERFPL